MRNIYHTPPYLALVIFHVHVDGTLQRPIDGLCGTVVPFQLQLAVVELLRLGLVVFQVRFQELQGLLRFMQLSESLILFFQRMAAVGTEFGLNQGRLGGGSGSLVGRFDGLEQVLCGSKRARQAEQQKSEPVRRQE